MRATDAGASGGCVSSPACSAAANSAINGSPTDASETIPLAPRCSW
jgi:hypothetical protein